MDQEAETWGLSDGEDSMEHLGLSMVDWFFIGGWKWSRALQDIHPLGPQALMGSSIIMNPPLPLHF